MSNFRVRTSQDGSRQFPRGGYGEGGNNSQSYYRGRGNNRNRPFRNRGGGRFRGSNYIRTAYDGPRSRLGDDDEPMGGDDDGGRQATQRRYTPYCGGPRRGYNGSRGGRGGDAHVTDRLGPVSPLPAVDVKSWFRILIMNSKKLTKDEIVKTISSKAGPFMPVNYQLDSRQDASFFVFGSLIADAIAQVSQTITMQDGRKLIIRKEGCTQVLPIQLSTENISSLKLAMSRRYEPTTFTLNMADFSNDQELIKEGLVFFPSRESVSHAIVKIIEENIPEMRAFDLSKNRIMSLNAFSRLADVAPNITAVNLSHNLLRHERDLQYWEKMRLEELFLDGNGLCDNFKDKQAYISAIRKRFPKVMKLDGHVLPPPITFDIDVPTTLPPTKESYFENDAIRELICCFVQQYFSLYDSDNRQPLLEAYDEKAIFSLTTYSSRMISNKSHALGDYNQACRNSRLRNIAQRSAQLKTGSLNVIVLLTSLPATLHDLQSFVVDVNVATPTMLMFTIDGVFKEKSSRSDRPPVRQFSRTFVTVPRGTGIAITNEMLTVSCASQDQIQKSFKSMTSAAAPSSSAAAVSSVSDPGRQLEMVKQFAVQSGMNENFSRLCLEQNEWNFNMAAQVFQEKQAKNEIPDIAFSR